MKVTNNYYNQSTPSFGSRIVPSEVLEKTISHFIEKPKRGQDLLVGLKKLALKKLIKQLLKRIEFH